MFPCDVCSVLLTPVFPAFGLQELLDSGNFFTARTIPKQCCVPHMPSR